MDEDEKVIIKEFLERESRSWERFEKMLMSLILISVVATIVAALVFVAAIRN